MFIDFYMLISRLNKKIKQYKHSLSAVCTQLNIAIKQFEENSKKMKTRRANFNNIISGKQANYASIKSKYAESLSTNWNYVLTRYFTEQPIVSAYNYIQTKDQLGNKNLRYKTTMYELNKLYRHKFTDNLVMTSSEYDLYVKNQQSKLYGQLVFYPSSALSGSYSDNFYNDGRVSSCVSSIVKKTYIVNTTNYSSNNEIYDLDNSDVIAIMKTYNKFLTNDKQNTNTLVGLLNAEINKLSEKLNKLFYDQSYRLASIQAKHNKILTDFISCLTDYKNYNNYLNTVIEEDWMSFNNMENQLTWQNYILQPNINTVWRQNLVTNMTDYRDDIFLPPSPLLSGDYGKNFQKKGTFNKIFYNQ